jgi:hypothetical protein
VYPQELGGTSFLNTPGFLWVFFWPKRFSL